jgi:DegV family protein with EDD domain
MRIFTDTACDLPKSYYDEGKVTAFPLSVELDGEVYKDVFEMDGSTLYEAIKNGAQPKTSQVSPDTFMTTFEELAKSGEEGIYIAFTSELSGTYSTAKMIRDQVLETYPELKLTIIDTKCASLGQGLVVLEAVRLKEEGKTLAELTEAITAYAASMNHLFTVDDLNFLARGGRVSKTSAFLGGMLNIKPVLHVEEGRLVPLEKIRGQKKAIKYMVDYVAEKGGDFSTKQIGICHSNDPELAATVQAALQERLNPASFYTVVIGSVIGSHVGLGTVGIFFTDAE